jgi:hypothetical protein
LQIAAIRAPSSVRTSSPVAWPIGACGSVEPERRLGVGTGRHEREPLTCAPRREFAKEGGGMEPEHIAEQ